MEIVYRRQGVIVEFCPKTEYLEKIIEQFRILQRIEEIRNDRMFEFVVESLRNQLNLVSGDANQITFRFSLEGKKHHLGPEYTLSRCGKLYKSSELRTQDIYGNRFRLEGPCVETLPIEELSAEKLLESFNLMAIQEIDFA